MAFGRFVGSIPIGSTIILPSRHSVKPLVCFFVGWDLAVGCAEACEDTAFIVESMTYALLSHIRRVRYVCVFVLNDLSLSCD